MKKKFMMMQQERSEEKVMDQKATRKKKVTKDFLRRCICITGISILALFGVFQLAQLQIEKVIGPLVQLLF